MKTLFPFHALYPKKAVVFFLFLIFYLAVYPSEEESYPVKVKQVEPHLGHKAKLATCLANPSKDVQQMQAKSSHQSRRHTISGLTVQDSSYRTNLRDDLLRSLADQAVKSMHATEEDNKELPIESYGRQHSRRRSTIVTDILSTTTPTTGIANDDIDTKPSLVTDVIMKFDPKKRGSRALIFQPQLTMPGMTRSAPLIKPGYVHKQRVKIENLSLPERYPQMISLSGRRMPGGRDSRLKELNKLRFTSAARAAKMALKEAQICSQANRRTSVLTDDHYLTLQTRTIHNKSRMQGSIDKDASANTKFAILRKKFQVGLNQDTLATDISSQGTE